MKFSNSVWKKHLSHLTFAEIATLLGRSRDEARKLYARAIWRRQNLSRHASVQPKAR